MSKITQKRVRELKQISAHLYADMLDKMGTPAFGRISAGQEETIVLAELARKINNDLANWVIDDNSKKE